jgi:hypothetical protein
MHAPDDKQILDIRFARSPSWLLLNRGGQDAVKIFTYSVVTTVWALAIATTTLILLTSLLTADELPHGFFYIQAAQDPVTHHFKVMDTKGDSPPAWSRTSAPPQGHSLALSRRTDFCERCNSGRDG